MTFPELKAFAEWLIVTNDIQSMAVRVLPANARNPEAVVLAWPITPEMVDEFNRVAKP